MDIDIKQTASAETFFKNFQKSFEVRDVEAHPHKVDVTPVVSVCVQTYQHAKYISKCLDGILKQETNFPFEILIGEDMSSDGTREICIEYARKYPDIIKLFLHRRENNIKINDRPSGRFNFIYNLHQSKGKYIALCEGDDFWIDSKKLQKQFDFIRSNSNCSLVFTGCEVHKIDGTKQKYSYNLPNLINAEDFLLNRHFMPTASLFFKREVLDLYREDWMVTCFAGDFVIKYCALSVGEIGGIPDITCIYNKGTEFSWSKRKLTKRMILKEYADNVRGLYFLGQHRNLKAAEINAKLKQKKSAVYYKIALLNGGIKGVCVMVANFKKIGLHRFLAYFKNKAN